MPLSCSVPRSVRYTLTIMASSHEQSRKKIVLQKYRTEICNTLSQCIEDALPDLESSGAISADQKEKVREYVDGKMPANAVDYLMDDHMKRPLSVESNKNFMKLLEVMKKAPKCSPQCKALAAIVEQDLTNDTSSDVDEVTKMLEKLENEKTKQIQELGNARMKEWEKWIRILYTIHKYGSSPAEERPLIAPIFLAKGPNDEIFVRDDSSQRLVVFDHQGDKLKYSRCIDGYNRFQDITGIAVGTEYLYVADRMLDCIRKLHLKTGQCSRDIGSHGSALSEFNSPFGLALDKAKSTLYVCDRDNHRIQVIEFKDEDDEITFSKFGVFETWKGYIDSPTDIALSDDKDRLFVTDHDNHIVLVFKIDGSLIGQFGDTNVKNPFGICTYVIKGWIYNTEKVLITSTSDNVVYKFASGKLVSTLKDYSYEFDYPCGVTVVANEQIVVASMNGNRLTVI